MHLEPGRSRVPRERLDCCGGRSGEVGRLWKRSGGVGRGGLGFWRGRILGVRGGFGHGRVVARGERAACGLGGRGGRCAGKGGEVVWD